MTDQALDGAVGPAIEDRIAAALGEEVETVSLEKPQDAELPQGDTGEPEPVAETTQEAPPEDAPPAWDDVREIKLKVPVKNGAEEKELEVTLEDLRLGYMRQDDYQRKTQEVAKARAEAQEQVKRAAAEIQSRAMQELQAMDAYIQQVSMPEFANVDWNKLATDDPAQFVQLTHKRNQLIQAREAVKQQLHAAEAQRVQEQSESRAQAIAQAQEQLKTEIPNWGDELQRALVKTGNDLGFTPEELGSVADPRFVKLLWKAHQFDANKGQADIAAKKVSDAPKVLKPSAPVQKSSSVAKLDELKSRIKKSQGRDKNAIEALIKSRLRG